MDITNLNVIDWTERHVDVAAAVSSSYDLRIVLDCHEPGLQGRVIVRGEDFLAGLSRALREYRSLSDQEIEAHVDESRQLRMPRSDILDELSDAAAVLKAGKSRLDRIEEQLHRLAASLPAGKPARSVRPRAEPVK